MNDCANSKCETNLKLNKQSRLPEIKRARKFRTLWSGYIQYMYSAIMKLNRRNKLFQTIFTFRLIFLYGNPPLQRLRRSSFLDISLCRFPPSIYPVNLPVMRDHRPIIKINFSWQKRWSLKTGSEMCKENDLFLAASRS